MNQQQKSHEIKAANSQTLQVPEITTQYILSDVGPKSAIETVTYDPAPVDTAPKKIRRALTRKEVLRAVRTLSRGQRNVLEYLIGVRVIAGRKGQQWIYPSQGGAIAPAVDLTPSWVSKCISVLVERGLLVKIGQTVRRPRGWSTRERPTWQVCAYAFPSPLRWLERVVRGAAHAIGNRIRGRTGGRSERPRSGHDMGAARRDAPSLSSRREQLSVNFSARPRGEKRPPGSRQAFFDAWAARLSGLATD